MLLQVQTTVAQQSDADRIAKHLLEQRLVACVQIQGPLQSHYHWQGKLESSSEWKCTCKTLPEVWRRVEAAIRSVHPYDVPEILANEVTASEDYLRWVKSEVRTEPTGDQP